MSNGLFETVLLPIADEDDAEATCAAFAERLDSDRSRVHVVHVIEKAGGAPDKASVEQREEHAERIFDAARAVLEDADVGVETEILYGTDVADAILDYADDVDASVIAFTPRGASRWIKLISGDVASELTSRADRPVLVLPRSGADGSRDGEKDDDGGGDPA